MPRITPLVHEQATGKAKELLDGVKGKFGFVPNMLATMAQSPAVLRAYLDFSAALATGTLNARVREQIALVVAETNSCDYCASAHSTIGKMVGLSDADVAAARDGAATDPKIGAILTLARDLVTSKGRVSDDQLRAARAAGLTDGEVAEVVANVAINIFTNYINHVADPVIDFPVKVKTRGAA
ncbi:MAG: carboxymuconolactone decarboxylase family protein [Planctomycetota bacterium]|nr:carboxymuconolactone decarboxylase family protein [Planctomycetota bacterium]